MSNMLLIPVILLCLPNLYQTASFCFITGKLPKKRGKVEREESVDRMKKNYKNKKLIKITLLIMGNYPHIFSES